VRLAYLVKAFRFCRSVLEEHSALALGISLFLDSVLMLEVLSLEKPQSIDHNDEVMLDNAGRRPIIRPAQGGSPCFDIEISLVRINGMVGL
jgi:hypothetical protein